jgi:hypothetical protein
LVNFANKMEGEPSAEFKKLLKSIETRILDSKKIKIKKKEQMEMVLVCKTFCIILMKTTIGKKKKINSKEHTFREIFFTIRSNVQNRIRFEKK